MVKDVTKEIKKVDSAKNEMLKQVQHDTWERLRNSRQAVSVIMDLKRNKRFYKSPRKCRRSRVKPGMTAK
jgi:hypothetical protein